MESLKPLTQAKKLVNATYPHSRQHISGQTGIPSVKWDNPPIQRSNLCRSIYIYIHKYKYKLRRGVIEKLLTDLTMDQESIDSCANALPAVISIVCLSIELQK